MEKEIDLLSRVVANHLFLGQFEPFRASLLSLQNRRPELALAILRRILSEGGRIDDVLWSSTCPSPSHLAWLSLLSLLDFGTNSASSIWRFDPEILRLKVEFLVLVQTVIFRVSEAVHRRSLAPDATADNREETSNQDIKSLRVLNQVLDSGLQRLKREVVDDVVLLDPIPAISEDELKCLWKPFLEHAEIVDTLGSNIEQQIRFLRPVASELAIVVRNEDMERVDPSVEETEALSLIQRSIQMAHLDV